MLGQHLPITDGRAGGGACGCRGRAARGAVHQRCHLTEELGAPIDPRAVRTVAAAGYRTDRHSAHQLTADEARAADLVIAMEPLHVDLIGRVDGETGNVSLLSDHDPTAEPGAGVPDPWYGGQDGFTATLTMIERAMPGVLDAVRRIQRLADARSGRLSGGGGVNRRGPAGTSTAGS